MVTERQALNIERLSKKVSRFTLGMVRVGVKLMLFMCICGNCKRTTARMGRYNNEEHMDQDPKIRQTNMHVIIYCFASSLCLRLVTSCGTVCE